MTNSTSTPDRDSIAKITFGIASPETIRSWSAGEVKKGLFFEHLNDRPFPDGLFCERIFGPLDDWGCWCGRLQGIQNEGVECRHCGVEVNRTWVRRERMGHVELDAPVAHPWFLHRTPSRIGITLDLKASQLVEVVNFRAYLVVDPGQTPLAVNQILDEAALEVARRKNGANAFTAKMGAEAVRDALAKIDLNATLKSLRERLETTKIAKELRSLHRRISLLSAFSESNTRPEWMVLTVLPILPAGLRTPEKSKAGLSSIPDINLLYRSVLQANIKVATLAKNKASDWKIRSAKLQLQSAVNNLLDNKPTDSVDANEPKIPDANASHLSRIEELAQSLIKEGRKINPCQTTQELVHGELNDLLEGKSLPHYEAVAKACQKYRETLVRTVVREPIRAAERELCESVEQLIQRVIPPKTTRRTKSSKSKNGIALKPTKPNSVELDDDAEEDDEGESTGVRGKKKKADPLESLAAGLEGKEGLFRGHLLGKRVNFSGRTVIVSGPDLRLHQCGLPVRMALRLFEPVIVGILLKSGVVDTPKRAQKRVKREHLSALEALTAIVQDRHPVLLGRNPTLHRHSIQAFEPVLIEGLAIQLHPMVCAGYNADFDGDQMTVHIPLSVEAQSEARLLMMSTANLLNPANGRLIITPTQDIMLGCYCLSADPHRPLELSGKLPTFFSGAEVHHVYEMGKLRMNDWIRFWNPDFRRQTWRGESDKKLLETTIGRVLLNEIFPGEVGFINEALGKKQLTELIEEVYRRCGRERAVQLLEQLKDIGLRAATKAGVSIGIDDLRPPARKAAEVEAARSQIAEIEKQLRNGLITKQERLRQVLSTWQKCFDSVSDSVEDTLKNNPGPHGHNPVWLMLASGARGTKAQVRQLTGLRGLMVKPTGEIIEVPILSSFREGLTVLEYFISSHGVRKGQADTAKKTGTAGYFMRKLINLAHDVVVAAADCQTDDGIWVRELSEDGQTVLPLRERLLGRVTAEDVKSPSVSGHVILSANQEITHALAEIIDGSGVKQVKVRSVLTCKLARGVCASCYGRNFATDRPAALGDAVGIIAAQSIGEPGTQLTLRTFHTGGVASKLTSQQVVSTTLFNQQTDSPTASVKNADITDSLARLDQLFCLTGNEHTAILAKIAGHVDFGPDTRKFRCIIVTDPKTGLLAQHRVPSNASIIVAKGMWVACGAPLTSGSIAAREILELCGPSTFQSRFLDTVQTILTQQGVNVHDKHIEVIVVQMLRAVLVTKPGDTRFSLGDEVEKHHFEEENQRVELLGGQPAEGKPVLLGITQPRIATDSPLASAGFRDTVSALVDAAAFSAVDQLRGLRECLMTGKLIPAGTGFGAYREIELKAAITTPVSASEEIR